MQSSEQAWNAQNQPGTGEWGISNHESDSFNDTWPAAGIFQGASDQPLNALLSEHAELSTYGDSDGGLFPETSTGATTMTQEFDLAPGDTSAAGASKEAAMDLGVMYSSPSPVPVAATVFQEEVKCPAPTDDWDTFLRSFFKEDFFRPKPFCLPPKPGGDNGSTETISANEALEIFINSNREEQRVPNAPHKQLPYSVPTTNPVMVERIVTAMCQARERCVPCSSNPSISSINFPHGLNTIPPGCPMFLTDNYVIGILTDGTTSMAATRAVPVPNRHPLSKKFVRHVDQSQAYNVNAHAWAANSSVPEILTDSLLVDALSCHGAAVPINLCDPTANPNPIAGLTPASSTKDLSICHMVPNELPAVEEAVGDGGGTDGWDNEAADYSPKQCNSSHSGDKMITLRGLHNQRQQQQEQQQQQPADSAATNGTYDTASRRSHSSLNTSDDESSQDAMDYAKFNPDEITFDELSNLFVYKQSTAAKKLGIGSTTLKKICRRFGLDRWPSRHLKSLIKLRDNLTTKAEIIAKFPKEEVTRALTEIEESLRGRTVSEFLKDFRQKVFKNIHTLKTKNRGLKKRKQRR